MEFLFQHVDTAIAGVLVAILVFLYFTRNRFRVSDQTPKPPEAEGGWPLFGHLHLFGGSSSQLPHISLGALADKYGPVFTIQIGVHPTLVINNWEVAKECYTTYDVAVSSRPKSIAAQILGCNYANFGFSPYGPFWRKMRKLTASELLSNSRLQMLKHVRAYEVESSIKELYKLWTKRQNGGDHVMVEMKQWIGDINLNVILRMVAGKRYFGATAGNDENEETHRCRNAIREFFHLSGQFLLGDAFPFLKWLDFSGYQKAMKKTAKELDSFVGEWLDEHRRKRDCGNFNGDQDFMDVMLSILDHNDHDLAGFDTDTVTKATSMSLISGGSDTTTVTLEWVLSLLLNHPSVLKKVKDELDIHVGKERLVNELDISNLVYLQAVVKETLRLYPAGPLSGLREFTEDCVIGGHHVRKGTRLITNLWKIQTDPRIWSDPLEYKPERFLTTHKDVDVKGKHFQLIPFGAGRRICPGMNFGLQMTELVLASLLHAFDISTSGPVDMTASFGLSVVKTNPLDVHVKPRLSTHLRVVKGNTAPEPKGAWPVIGHLHMLVGSKPPHITLGALADKYGPVFTVRIGLHPALVICNSEAAKDCFTINDMSVSSRPQLVSLKHIGYDHAMFSFAPYGTYWREVRKMSTLKLLSNRQLELLKPIRVSEVATFIKKIHQLWTEKKNVSRQGLVEMKQWFGDLTLNVILRMVAGKRYSIAANARDVMPYIGWLDLGGYEKAMKKTAKDLDDTLDKWLEEHKRKRQEVPGGGDQVDREGQNFMDVMLSVLDQDSDLAGYDADRINKATSLTMISSANDTITVVLTWALSLLLNNRHVLKKAKDELDACVGRERVVDESDLNKLVYIQAIVKETLRLYPAAPLSGPREFTEDCTIAGYHFPKGTRLFTNLWKIQTDPQIWSDPLVFNPERFMTTHRDVDFWGRQHFEYIPFGSGRRVCPAISFAWQMVNFSLASFLHAFDISTPSDAVVDMTESFGLTNLKATPLEVVVTPRLPASMYYL
ncbi:hypothetical protein FNV43_RR11422 [Rhamnella rubrinervis]|uniref:Cytochrome P450 n=1 Tax=Rhamnella rubrinervis TaxID=2594499 RepID=A0A8K0MHU9_9ROSA|nr:hypothetical protein FNV43_RR11422 [Rhamnella rubrinervis]